MLRTHTTLSLPIPVPIALLDATLLFIIQLLIAQHPDLLAPPEEPAPRTPGLRAARRIFDAVRDLHGALDSYQTLLDDPHALARGPQQTDDDIPF